MTTELLVQAPPPAVPVLNNLRPKDLGLVAQNECHLLFRDPATLKELEALLDRALNCHPDAPAWAFELSDRLKYGEPLQSLSAKIAATGN